MMEEKKRIIFHPILFALYPILELYVNVSGSVTLRNALRSFVVIPLIALILLLLIKWRVKDWDRAGFLTTSLLFLFLFYGIVYRVAGGARIGNFRLGRHAILFPVWFCAIAVLASRWAWKQLHDHRMVTKFLNFASMVTIVLSLSRYAIKVISYEDVDVRIFADAVAQWDQQMDFHLEGEQRPDIYYIILDGYGRADVLQELYGFDNTEFLSFLESRGFYIADASQANYIQTILSLSAVFNFDYLNDLPLPKNSEDRDAMAYLISNSRVRALLEQQGYRLITVNSGYEFTVIRDADVIFGVDTSTSGLNAFEELILTGSAAALLVDSGILELPSIGYAVQRDRVRAAFDNLAQVPQLDGAKFVFFHIVAPHPPFLFDSDGNSVTPNVPFAGGGDGSNFFGTTDQYIAGYTAQVQYVNVRMQHIVDEILAQSETPPIIIIQGDHGPGAFLNWGSVEDTCLKERVSVLNTYYFPEGAYDLLYKSITPVNSFRVIFDTYFGTDLGLLDDHVYFTTWLHPFDFIDIDTQSQSPCIRP